MDVSNVCKFVKPESGGKVVIASSVEAIVTIIVVVSTTSWLSVLGLARNVNLNIVHLMHVRN